MGIHFDLLHHQIKFHPKQMKSVEENDANRFCFALALRPPGKVKVSESGLKW